MAAAAAERGEASTIDRQGSMSRVQHLKQLYAIETCWQCGGWLRIIASGEHPAGAGRILERLNRAAASVDPIRGAAHAEDHGGEGELVTLVLFEVPIRFVPT